MPKASPKAEAKPMAKGNTKAKTKSKNKGKGEKGEAKAKAKAKGKAKLQEGRHSALEDVESVSSESDDLEEAYSGDDESIFIVDKIQELMEFDIYIPKFKKLIVADFSCSPLDDVLEEESTERDKRYITNMLDRTSSYTEPTDDFIDNY